MHLNRVFFALLHEFDLTEIAHHVGQQIGLRVADFIKHLLAHRQGRDQAAGTLRFADDKLAVGADFDDRKNRCVRSRARHANR